jgi:hypothetical protein
VCEIYIYVFQDSRDQNRIICNLTRFCILSEHIGTIILVGKQGIICNLIRFYILSEYIGAIILVGKQGMHIFGDALHVQDYLAVYA